MNLIVVPAYGRDYLTKEQALSDWNKGKDFVFTDSGASSEDEQPYDSWEEE